MATVAASPRAASHLDGPNDRHAIDALVRAHADLVRIIAYRMLRRMPPHIDADDLIQTGMVGLLEAAQRYHHRTDASFASFASLRIRGAMLDLSRSTDWCARSVRRRLRSVEGAKQRLEQVTGMAARPSAVAAAAGITLAQYFKDLRDAHLAVQVSLDEPGRDGAGVAHPVAERDTPDPAEEWLREKNVRALVAAIDALPERERVVFLLYHEQEHRLREIGLMLAISESRVCQIRKQSIRRLRAAMC